MLSWNTVTGCTKISAGCQFCICEQMWSRLSANDKTDYSGRDFADIKLHHDKLTLPVAKAKPRVFNVNPMSDTFHDYIPDEYLDRLFAIMLMANQHHYHILTKRIARARQYLASPDRLEYIRAAANFLLNSGDRTFDGYSFTGDIPWPLPNVWLGVSVENQKEADARIPALQDTPAARRFIVAEPLLGNINLRKVIGVDGYPRNVLLGTNKINWVVTGCEIGPARRKLDIDWVRQMRQDCKEFETNFHLKQLFTGFKVESNPRLDGHHSVEVPFAIPPQNNGISATLP